MCTYFCFKSRCSGDPIDKYMDVGFVAILDDSLKDVSSKISPSNVARWAEVLGGLLKLREFEDSEAACTGEMRVGIHI